MKFESWQGTKPSTSGTSGESGRGNFTRTCDAKCRSNIKRLPAKSLSGTPATETFLPFRTEGYSSPPPTSRLISLASFSCNCLKNSPVVSYSTRPSGCFIRSTSPSSRSRSICPPLIRGSKPEPPKIQNRSTRRACSTRSPQSPRAGSASTPVPDPPRVRRPRSSNISASGTRFRTTRSTVSAGPRAETSEGKTPVIGDDQARALLDAPPADTLKGKRDRAILAVFLFHGLRCAELCQLRVKDLRDRQGVRHLRVHGKDGKIRYVPAHALAFQRISGYLEVPAAI